MAEVIQFPQIWNFIRVIVVPGNKHIKATNMEKITRLRVKYNGSAKTGLARKEL